MAPLKRHNPPEHPGWVVTKRYKSDPDYGVYERIATRSDAPSAGLLWVVTYRDTGEVWIVDGPEGDCGKEPRVAGPYKTESSAIIAADMLMAMTQFSDRHPGEAP